MQQPAGDTAMADQAAAAQQLGEQAWGGAPAAVASAFQEQAQQAQQAATQFQNGLPVVFMPPEAGVAAGGASTLPMTEQQQQQWGAAPAAAVAGVAAEQGGTLLPGLTSMSAAEAEARAAAESDEEEYWALPTAPLLRLEFQQLALAGSEGQRQPLLPAPDMLPGALQLAGAGALCIRGWMVAGVLAGCPTTLSQPPACRRPAGCSAPRAVGGAHCLGGGPGRA